jgi:hypothetical protein
MKHLLLKLSFFATLAIFTTSASAQCNTEAYEAKCLEKVNKIGFTFLKTYKIDGESRAKIEFPYIFTQGSSYLVTLASKDEDNKGLVLTLYDSNHKQVATNHSADSNNKYLSGVKYDCNTTGIYYLSFTFESGKDKCAASVLSFKRSK